MPEELNDRVTRLEESKQGLNTYLPLLLKRFEGIEDRFEANLNAVRQELRADLNAVRQELKTDLHSTEQKIDGIRSDNRVMLVTLIISVFVLAGSIYLT